MILSLIVFIGTFAVVFAAGFWFLELGVLWSMLAASAFAAVDVALVQQFRRLSRPLGQRDAMRVVITSSMLITAISLFSTNRSEDVLMTALSWGAAACSAAVVVGAWVQLRRLGVSEQ